MNIVKAHDVPSRLQKAIRKMYENTRTKIIAPNGETESSETASGVLQRNTFGP